MVFQVFSKSSSELELVALYPLTVQEGGVAVITTQNIDVVLDHHKYGVRPSGVLLHVAQSPEHGRIAIDLSLQRNSPQYTSYMEGEKSKQTFTLMDLSRDKVYIRLVHICHVHIIIKRFSHLVDSIISFIYVWKRYTIKSTQNKVIKL